MGEGGREGGGRGREGGGRGRGVRSEVEFDKARRSEW